MKRPNFRPLWQKEKAIEKANAVLRPDHPSAIGTRIAFITLSSTPEEMMKWALESDEGTLKGWSDTLMQTTEQLQARLALVNMAHVRMLEAAGYVLVPPAPRKRRAR